jgi:predicted alpha/beta hydrolase family esterase
MKKQVIVIHGGDTFDSYEDYLAYLTDWEVSKEMLTSKGWKSTLQSMLGEGYEVLKPTMPNEFNCKYVEWKIWFEKFTPFFIDEVILVGHSLGGIFLAKYLAENILPKKITALFLIAAPFDDVDTTSLADFVLPDSLELITKQVDTIYLYQSEDDPIVPFSELAKYQLKLPGVHIKIFKDKGHFNQETFPELVESIQQS